MPNTFSSDSFRARCDDLAAADPDLAGIIRAYGYPPMWNRPNTFETLVHFILEQQVSLASALSGLNKLREKLVDITPQKILQLTDPDLKACYFSRQKTGYVRCLAESVLRGETDLHDLPALSDEEVRAALTALKGIGNWTADVYLIFVLQRADIFPLGDLAAINALRQVKSLAKGSSREELLQVVERWRPNRSIATMLLWHQYLSSRGKK